MRIAYIGQKGIPMTQGGVEAHVENLAVEMAKLGHEVFVYTRDYYTDKNLKEYKGVKLISIPSIRTKNLDTITHVLFSTIHALFQKYDVIHYHSVGASLMSFIPRIFSRAKVVGTFHCLDRFHQKWGFFARLMLRIGEWTVCYFPHKTIAVSQYIQKYCLDDYGKKVDYIPNGFSIEKNENTEILEKLNIKPKKYFLYVTRLIRHKGVHYLIDAYKKLNNPDFQLVIVGDTFHNDDYKMELMKMVENEKNIIFTGTQMDGNLDALFTHAYAYVLPSENEGLSISFLEAMAHGLPLIASEIEANQDFIDKGLIYGFKNKDVQGLKTKMSWMIENYDTALAKAQKTAEYIQENFSWNKIANQIQELYKQNECLQNLHKKAFVQKTSK
ncbi:MAG TPA: glycosyltransferase family 4 protein [bacterium]|jgi:glycosyltransferase involved in cell wall biosynthesis|nr:glycosyltransferase family 4 protein [bacterium]HOG38444.1 glycosyltransferase family 4 protein [bacterium]